MRFIILTAAIFSLSGQAAIAQTAGPAPATAAVATAAPAKFGPSSTFKELVANPKAKALLDAQIPLIMQVFEMGMFPDSTPLEAVAADASAQNGGGFTAEVYAKLQADLAKL